MKKYDVNYHGSFSDRSGIRSLKVPIQVDELNTRTRNELVTFASSLTSSIFATHNEIATSKEIMSKLFNDPITYDKRYSRWLVEDAIISVILENEYDQVLTAIEYLCRYLAERKRSMSVYADKIFRDANDLFEQECVGYRFVNEFIAPITSEVEIKTIEDAIDIDIGRFSKHIENSLRMLSDRKNPDYPNAIKEAVTALEELTNCLLNKTGCALGESIDDMGRQKGLHPCLVGIIKKIYGYASDENGIRHGNGKDKEHQLSFDEAKYILLLCCSTANYLVSLHKD